MATRWGIAGAGRISHDFAASVNVLPKSEHRLVAVAARDPKRAREFAKSHGVESSHGSYEELARDKNVEIVYIGTLNTSHFEIGQMMLNAGKHVLCEKPLTMNLEQTKRLIELARAKGLFLMEAIWSRCFPAYETLRQELAKGTIGQVRQLSVTFGHDISAVDRLKMKSLGGGSILDLGVYVIQLACLVFDHERPVEIKAAGYLNEEGVDLSMSASLVYEDGRTASIATQTTCLAPNDASIIGTEGWISLPLFWAPTEIVLPGGVRRRVSLPETELPLFHINSAGLHYEAMEVRECLKKGLKESPKVTHAHSLLIAEIEDELRRQIGVVYDQDK
ncbi:hypothetical protein TKK_0004201 [Trichogramma kaykai]|uniref:Trans-1,2-dihydrobenzene-1,2-diol dehydrogenase n=1 Tax=Trichogramma kaykai TaxID=54128 RepID=A0ABD2XMI8_9HYME